MVSDQRHHSRKMAVILHADVAGSTTLVQLDESLTHTRIRDAFNRFSQTIEQYGGTVHEIRGDALVAEFPRASDAVCAALVFQAAHTEHLAQLTDEIVPSIRIGISLGEVIFADNTVTGAGVVLAQRLEHLAEPGGVCIQQSVYETLPRRMPFDYVTLGKQQLKGFDESVEAYTVSQTEDTEIPPPEIQAATEPPRSHGRAIKTGIAAIALLIIGIIAWWQPWDPAFTPASVERMKFPLPEKPSIAVLPFDNLSGDPKQEFFADGITEDIITSLSRIPDMFVIARNSTFTYKGKPVKVQQVAEDLGIRYVLEGSVQRSEDKVRITAQLIDALSGRHLWAERYDRDFKEIFALQDDVTRNVATALQVKLTAGEQARVWRRQTDSSKAYEYFLRGNAHHRSLNKADVAAAKEFYEKAVTLDPNFAAAWLRVAAMHQIEARFGWDKSRAQSLSSSTDAVQKALAIDDTQPGAYLALANIAIIKRQYDQAIGHCEKALTLDPTAFELAHCGRIWTYVGRPEEALELITKAMRRNPYFHSIYFFTLGNAHRLMENYDEAIAVFKSWGDADTKSLSPLLMLTHAYAEAGRMEEARATIKESLKRFPKLSMKRPTKVLRYKDPAKKERMLANLRAAGVPE